MMRNVLVVAAETMVTVALGAVVVAAAAAPAAADNDIAGGWIPDGAPLSPFDVADPAVGRLDPGLLETIQQAANSAAAEGITLGLTSGWRSPEYQQQLFDDAVVRYGSAEIASQYVAPVGVSKHVIGEAVDVGPASADDWLLRNGQRFGLCQIYANEIWHFELATDYGGICPPLRPNAAG